MAEGFDGIHAHYAPYQQLGWLQNDNDVTDSSLDDVTSANLLQPATVDNTGVGTHVTSSSGVMMIREPVNVTLALTVVCCFMLLVGIVGNLMVGFVVWQNKTMRTSTNFYLVSLCAADMVVLLICLPSALFEYYMDDVWYLGDISCKYFYIFSYNFFIR